MNEEGRLRSRWQPLPGSWEEAVLSWPEQVESAFRRRRGAKRSRAVPHSLGEDVEPVAPRTRL